MLDTPEVKYKIIEWEGDLKGGTEARHYHKDDSIRNESGQWLAKHPGAVDITSETAPIMRARAIQLRQEAAEQGIANAVMSRNGNMLIGPVAAWARVSEHVADLVYDADKDSDKINAFRALSDVTPSKYDKGSQQQQAAQAAPTVNIEQMLVVLAMRQQAGDNSSSTHMPPCDTMQVANDSDVIEGDATDSDEHTRTQKNDVTG